MCMGVQWPWWWALLSLLATSRALTADQFILESWEEVGTMETSLQETKASKEIEAACGPHPLQSVLDKLSEKQPRATHSDLVKVLAVLSIKAPRIWNNYEQALSVYTNCKLMATSGSLG